MRRSKLLRNALVLAVVAGLSMNAAAESTAFCEVKKDGEKKNKATGHCDFVDQGDRITIKLTNGEDWALTRKKDKKNAFKDQKGNGVQRESKKNGTIIFKWEHRKITVWPDGT
jgi:hypothetical protein